MLTNRERVMYAVNGLLISDGPTKTIEFLEDLVQYCSSPIIKEVMNVSTANPVDSTSDLN